MSPPGGPATAKTKRHARQCVRIRHAACAEVMQAVAGREHGSVPAKANGYVRRYLAGRIYPGIAVDLASSVEGKVYLDVDAAAIARLDYFEGPEYVRRKIDATLADGSTLAVEAYIVPAEKRHLLTDRPWQLEEFVAAGLDDFLAHARQCMVDFKPGAQVRR